MPADPKYAKGRLTVHLTELIEYANNFRHSSDPLTQMMQRVLIDLNAYAGMDDEGRFHVHKRLTQENKRPKSKAKAQAEAKAEAKTG
jgi:hypothetical protein